jgi:murein L,D-transpeptidase YcbB/YkuD
MKNFAKIFTGIIAIIGAGIIIFNQLRDNGAFGIAQSQNSVEPINKAADKITDLLSLDNGAVKKADALMVINFLEGAENHGLSKPDLSTLSAKINKGEKITEDDKALLRAEFIKFGTNMNGGRVPWKNVSGYWLMRTKARDFGTEFDTALANDNMQGFVNSIVPTHNAYVALMEMRAKYAAIVKNGGFIKIGAAPELKLGMTDEKVGTLRNRLAQEDFTALNSTTPTFFDDGLKKQVENYQKSHNLKITGELNENTLKALEISAADRLKQIDLNLERERWIPRDNPPIRIEANIANQRVIMWDNGVKRIEMPAIVGKDSTKTPILADNIRAVVFNPPWYKPASIKGRVRVQPPGPGNSLGRVKFDMENGHAIYLHDTPNHALFEVRNRTFSHGCVRLHYPKDLAAILLKEKGYTREKIDEITSTVKTQAVKLDVKTPVLILYRTAFVDEIDGKKVVYFTSDPYKWDKALDELLTNGKISAGGEATEKAVTNKKPKTDKIVKTDEQVKPENQPKPENQIVVEKFDTAAP